MKRPQTMTNFRHVTIVQDYIPEYRKVLFLKMSEIAFENKINLRFAILNSSSNVSTSDEFMQPIFVPFVKLKIFGKILFFRNVRKILSDSDLVIFEQSRRFLDLYVNVFLQGKKIALWGHGADFVQVNSKLKSKALKYLTNHVKWFFGYTKDSIDYVHTIGFPLSNTTNLWNTIDINSLSNDLETVSQEMIFDYKNDLNNQ